jgi:hypothetical protein
MSLSDFVVGSNAVYFVILAYLLYIDKLARYASECAIVSLAAIASIYYHMCWSWETGQCIGPTSRSSARDIYLMRDILFSYLSLVSLTCVICNELWWAALIEKHAERARAIWTIGSNVLAFVLVVHFGDELPTSITMPLLCGGLVLFSMLWHIVTRRSRGMGWPKWPFWVSFALGGALMLVGFVVRVVFNQFDFRNVDDGSGQSDAYLRAHGVWHIFSALGTLLLVMMATNIEGLFYAPIKEDAEIKLKLSPPPPPTSLSSANRKALAKAIESL